VDDEPQREPDERRSRGDPLHHSFPRSRDRSAGSRFVGKDDSRGLGALEPCRDRHTLLLRLQEAWLAARNGPPSSPQLTSSGLRQGPKLLPWRFHSSRKQRGPAAFFRAAVRAGNQIELCWKPEADVFAAKTGSALWWKRASAAPDNSTSPSFGSKQPGDHGIKTWSLPQPPAGQQ